MHRERRGAALILAIFTCTILTVLAVSLVQIARVELIVSRASLDRLQTRYLAEAGFNLGRSLLMYEDEPDVDGPEDTWFTLQNEPELRLGDGWSKVAVIDACSLININWASESMLANILGDPEAAAAVVAWREEGNRFSSIGELAQVAGLSRERLAEVAKFLTVESLERNATASGEKRVNLNEVNPSNVVDQLGLTLQQAQEIYSHRRDSPDGMLQYIGELLPIVGRASFKSMVDRVTLANSDNLSGKVNINTAPREVLLALPGMTPQVADAIIAKRQEKGGAFKSVGELLDIPGISDDDFIALCDHVCTKSSTYIIESWAGLNDKPARLDLQGTVLRQRGPIAPLISGWREAFRPVYIQLQQGSTK